MKMIREIVDAMVFFDGEGASPMLISCSKGSIRINRVLKVWRERRNLKECYIYLCRIDERDEPMELRWEIESNRWFMEKY